MIEDNGAKTATTRKCGTEKGVDVKSRIHENAVERHRIECRDDGPEASILDGDGITAT